MNYARLCLLALLVAACLSAAAGQKLSKPQDDRGDIADPERLRAAIRLTTAVKK
jgi:hypothetical protein